MDTWSTIDEITRSRPSAFYGDISHLQKSSQSNNNPFISQHLEQSKYSQLPNLSNNFIERSVNVENPFLMNDDSQFGHLLQNFTTAFTETLKNFNADIKSNNSKPVVYFYGYEHENPIQFLKYLDEYFLNNNVEDDFSKIQHTASLLKGEAKKWFEPYISLNISWTCFCDRFLYKFNDISITASYTAKLYGEKQNFTEKVSEFVSKKIALFNRLEPNRSEEHKSAIIMELLKPDIRSRLRRFGPPVSCENLLHISASIERDLLDEQKMCQKNQPVQPSTETSRNSTEPPSPCKYCGGWHFHRDCPRKQNNTRQDIQPENSRRVGIGPPQQQNPTRNSTMGNTFLHRH